VLNAGPTTCSALHVIGALFHNAYADGNPANRPTGMQTVTIAPGGGYMVEAVIPDAGLYPFGTHSFAFAGLGALGLLDVRASAEHAGEPLKRRSACARRRQPPRIVNPNAHSPCHS
jgi:nitrite reductase (NO-forming)